MRLSLLKKVFFLLSLILLYTLLGCEAQQLMLDEDAYDSTLTLYANYGANETSVQRFAADYPFVLKDNPFIRPGYAFVGWADKPDSSLLSYGNHSNILLKADSALYALWEIETYTVHYVTNGGKRMVVYPEQYTVKSSIPLNTAKNGKYYFGGWYEQADFSGEAISEIPEGTTSDKTVYARWCGLVTYHPNGGTLFLTDALEEHVAYYTIYEENLLPVPVREDKSFAGWHASSALTDEAFIVLSGQNALSIDLYADWADPEQYTISYELYGGTNAKENPVQYDNAVVAVPLYAPTYEGYVFAGWYRTADFSGEPIEELSAYDTGDVVLYAKWQNPLSVGITETVAPQVLVEDDIEEEPVTDTEITVSFDANGGTGTMDAVTLLSENVYTLPENQFSYAGYTFAGWSAERDSAVLYEDAAEFTGDENTTLYAQWQYTVSFDTGNVSLSCDDSVVAAFDAVTLPTLADRTDAFRFAGWTTESAASSVQYLAEETVAFEASVTLYAVWTQEEILLIPDDGVESDMRTYYSLRAFASDFSKWHAEDARYTLKIKQPVGYAASEETGSLGEIISDRACITTVIIEDNDLEELPDGLFKGCKYLEHVIVPTTVHTLGAEVFADCESLQDFDISGITRIGKDAFKGCTEALQDTVYITDK